MRPSTCHTLIALVIVLAVIATSLWADREAAEAELERARAVVCAGAAVRAYLDPASPIAPAPYRVDCVMASRP